MTSFLKAVISGIRDDLKKQLKSSWKLRLKESFSGEYDQLFFNLDEFLEKLNVPSYVDIMAIRKEEVHRETSDRSQANSIAGVAIDATGTPSFNLQGGAESTNTSDEKIGYSQLLMRSFNLNGLITQLKSILEPLQVKHLFVFVDDFSELPRDAMKTVVDILIAPLNNWSEELIKFKIAAYPGRIHYGQLDKSKIEEINLDLHSLHGRGSVREMEAKTVEFTKRLVTTRLNHFGLDPADFMDTRNEDDVWRALFYASLGTPRTLGYILFFVYESQLLYGKQITARGVKEAAEKYYEEKIEPYFSMNAFLLEAFDEKSTIFSLKELLESIVSRARSLRSKDKANIFNKIDGQHPTSHFNTSTSLESLLSSLELNFFITKYFEMSNRDGNRVSVFALNYGLCEKYTIAFGRPMETDQRHYFVERVFDYNPILQDYVSHNQEIKCDSCKHVFKSEDLEALKRFRMLCPECQTGLCVVTNVSKKYASAIENVQKEQLLPSTELGILQALNSENHPLQAGDIAGELDVSHQLIGRRARNLDDRELISRDMVQGRRKYSLTESAKRIYFGDTHSWGLDFSDNG